MVRTCAHKVTLALAALAVLTAPLAAGAFVRSYIPSFDLYIDEANPATNYSSADPIYIANGTGMRESLIWVRLATAALADGEVLDSAYVVVFPAGSPLDTLTIWTREILRSVTNTATWNKYDTLNEWQTPGALGALDVNLSTDYGYGTNGVLYERVMYVASPPESLFIARGAAFSTWVDGKLGGTVRLILQVDAVGDSAQLSIANASSRLRVYGHTEGARRRVITSE